MSVMISGCSYLPKQKAGSEALAEAICVYEKKIDQKSVDLNQCIANQIRLGLSDPVSDGSSVSSHAL